MDFRKNDFKIFLSKFFGMRFQIAISQKSHIKNIFYLLEGIFIGYIGEFLEIIFTFSPVQERCALGDTCSIFCIDI